MNSSLPTEFDFPALGAFRPVPEAYTRMSFLRGKSVCEGAPGGTRG